MVRPRFGDLSFLAILLFAVSLSASPAFASPDGRWSLSVGAGVADQFTYRSLSYPFGSFDEQFGFSGLVAAGVSRRLSDHVFLRADLGYLGYQKNLQLMWADTNSGVAGMWPSGSVLTAQMPFVGVGTRLYVTGPGAARPHLYVEALPTIWVERWRERIESPQNYFYPSRVSQDAFTAMDPGFSAGVGLVGRLVGSTRLDVGLRYLFSAGVGEHHLGDTSSGNFKGLRQAALVMSVQVPL